MKNRKRLLWLLPYLPFPPLSGGNVRVFNLLKHLAEELDIHLLSFIEPGTSPGNVSRLSDLCGSVNAVTRKPREGELPLIFQDYYTAEMRSALAEALKERYDFIQIDFLTMAYYAKDIKEAAKDTPLLFTEHDVSWMDFEKCFHNRHLRDRDRYFEWVRMGKLIDDLYSLFDTVITVSANDALILGRKYPGKKIFTAPTGTDCGYYSFKRDRKVNDIVYTGHYVHYPNVDSVNYLIEEIYPLVRSKCREIRLFVVGSGGERVFHGLKKDGVTVTGTVSDIRPFLHKCGMFVAPVRIGVGIRGKILEAMACGLPVITSELGAAGIGALNGVHLLTAESPEEFARCAEMIISDRKMSLDMSDRARRFVEEKYDWRVRATELLNVYNMAKGSGSGDMPG